MIKDDKDTCIQIELADYCFDREVIADPEYDEGNIEIRDILNVPDDADLVQLKNIGIVEDLLTQGSKK